ncbi:hypothetical protein [Undibacterium sp. Ji49W]|uniref:hypothetical protein n=1 Tax=Undibacterium sp. Ji49W TaxID=3413040 RepID=UPI003BF1DA64
MDSTSTRNFFLFVYRWFNLCVRTMFFMLASFSLSGCSHVVEFEQIFTGFNGPKVPGLHHFESKDELEKSWIKSALSPSDYEKFLSKVNFDQQILIAVSVGELENASKDIQISTVRLIPVQENLIVDVSVKVGVVSNDCAKFSTSFPFVIGVFEKSKKSLEYGGYELSNFDAGCKSRIVTING